MPKRIEPMERYEIIKRLKLKESIRKIHRETGYSRETIRELKALALKESWLESTSSPNEKEISKHFNLKKDNEHPLNRIKDKIIEWIKLGYTYVVITELIKKDSLEYNEITVRRYIKKNIKTYRKATIRRQFSPGEYAEVDFGYFGLMYDEDSKRNRKVWFFSMRLNYSRYVYRQLVFRQDADTFFACHIHAFEYFGGVPNKIVCDNLKAAIIKACIHEPLVNRSYKMLAEHYNFLISATKPRTPEHKGGVEKDVDYVKRNFYPLFKEEQKNLGRTNYYYRDCKDALEKWTKETDNKHKIKYTNGTPEILFQEEEPLLQKLTLDRWDPITWYNPTVGDDWKVQIEKAFYSVPCKYIGEKVTAYINSSEVVVFYDYDEITRHTRAKNDWERIINPDHAPPNYREYLNTTSIGVKRWARFIGQSVIELTEIILNQKGIDGLRPARGLCGLSKEYGVIRLNNACRRALYYNLHNFKSVKNILIKELDFLPLDEIKKDCSQALLPFERNNNYEYARNGNYFNY